MKFNIKITNVIPGGPSSLQGELKTNDLILKVAQEGEEAVDIIDWRISDAVKIIRGPKGSKVTLTVRKPDGSEKNITITRDIVVLEETYAKSSIVEEGAFCTNISPCLAFWKANNTKSTASSSDIKNLVIFSFVIVISFLFLICLIKSGITDPLDIITFPYLTIEILVVFFLFC